MFNYLYIACYMCYLQKSLAELSLILNNCIHFMPPHFLILVRGVVHIHLLFVRLSMVLHLVTCVSFLVFFLVHLIVHIRQQPFTIYLEFQKKTARIHMNLVLNKG